MELLNQQQQQQSTITHSKIQTQTKSKQTTQKKIIDYSQKQSNKENNITSTLQKFKENQSDIQEQLNSLMLQYKSQPQQQQKHQIIVSNSNHIKTKEANTNIEICKIRNQKNTLNSSNVHTAENNHSKNQISNHHQLQNLKEIEARVSGVIGVNADTELEDFEKLKNQCTQDYLNEENTANLQLPLSFHTNISKDNNHQPIKSKSPVLGMNSHNMNTPTSLLDIKLPQQQPNENVLQFLNGIALQQNIRNLQQPLSLGFKSHNPPLDNNNNNNNDKKKQVTGNTTNSTTNPSSMQNVSKKVNQNSNHQIKDMHKKSQSLYNKKIVDIISGLQQSLGVIASNVKNSFNYEDLLAKQNQQQTLIESALLAQKLAKMTEGLGSNSNNVSSSNNNGNKSEAQSLKRKSMKVQSTLSGRGSLNVVKKKNSAAGFQTIEDNDKKKGHVNRMSIDLQSNVRGNSIKANHNRTRSDIHQVKKSNIINQPQQIMKVNHSKQKTLLTGSLYAMEDNSQSIINNRIQEDLLLKNYISNRDIPVSVKSLNKGSISKTNNTDTQPSSDNTKTHRQNTISMNFDSNFSEVMAQKYKSSLTNPQCSGQTSTLGNYTIDYQRQSLNPQPLKIEKTQGERQSDVHTLNMNKKANALLLLNLGQKNVEQKLKSAASSPNLHGSTTQSQQQANKKSHQSSQSNTIFDFGTYISNQAPAVSTLANLLTTKPKVVNQKKKNLITVKKDNIINNNNNNKQQHHKRSTSDGSSINKMFHFKQQMLINKIVASTNINTASNSQSNTTQAKNAKSQIQNQLQFISSLSTKRLSNEDNLQNIGGSTSNYNSPRVVLNCNQIIQEQPEIKLSQDMKSFLQKFQTKSSLQQQQQQQKDDIKNLIINNPSNVAQIQKQKPILSEPYFSNPSQSNQKPQFNLQSNQQDKAKKKDKAQDQILSNVQAQQIQKSHKRAKSDIHKQPQQKQQKQQQQLQQQQQQQKQQKIFFLNFNAPQLIKDQNKQSEKQVHSVYSNNDHNSNNIAHSARQSPNSRATQYIFDETQKQYPIVNNFIPTSRSDQSTKLKNTMSNQTTQKKCSLLGQDQRHIDHINTRLIYNDQSNDQFKVTLRPNVNEYNNIQVANIILADNNVYNFNKKDKKQINNFQSPLNKDNNLQIVSQLNFKSEDQAMNLSPSLKVFPTPKAVQPGFPLTEFNNNDQHPNQTAAFQLNEQVLTNHELEGQQFRTFDTNMTTHTFNNLTPRTRDKYRLIKQIKISFNKLKEPIKTSAEFYRIGKMLGKGAFGRVNLAIHKLCNQLVAVKSINKQYLSEDEASKKKMMQEVLILQKTRNQHIVRLYDSFETNKHIVFVMELCAGGDLLNYVRKRRKLKEEIARYIFRQVVDGLQYCHSKGIVHRDMKLDNLLLDERGIVKICDFGVSKLLGSTQEIMTEQCGTPAYIAPEILKDKGYKGFAVDIWSLGVCLYAMLYGTVPFKANNMSELHKLIMKAKYTLKDDTKNGEAPLSEDVKNLIKLLLEPNPEKRITIQAIKQHKWLQAQDPENIEIFTLQEKETIRKDFTYQDMSRYKRNNKVKKLHLEGKTDENNCGQVLTTEENLFTEHALDSTQNALMKNCSTKSIILAPFNSTISHIDKDDLDQDSLSQEQEIFSPRKDIDKNMIVDKKIIKFAPRVKDINRQYEINNNCEVDNGVYNKFIKNSTEDNKNLLTSRDQSQAENSLITSMNNEQNNEYKKIYAAPLVSQNTDEDLAADLIKKNIMQNQSELQQLQSYIQMQKTEFNTVAEDELLIDYEVVERVEIYGYPRQFIIDSIENFDMNDATTNYFLLDKEKQQIEEDFNGNEI